MKKFVCTVCGYVYEGEAEIGGRASSNALRYFSLQAVA